MRGASHARSLALSLRRIDPYWRSQLLVVYSKDLGAYMILDDPDGDDRYIVDDVVIYSYGRIFLTRSLVSRRSCYMQHMRTSLLCTLMHISS